MSRKVEFKSQEKRNKYWKNYYKEYNRKYKQTKKYNNSGVGGYVYFELGNLPEFIKTEPIFEDSLAVEEIIICSFFGCGKRLSLLEKLAGNKCIEHQNITKTIFHNGKL